MRNRSWQRLVAVLGLAPLLAASVAHARWPVQPDQFIELTARGKFIAAQSACSDGVGGAFVAWGSLVPLGQFVQHLDAFGDTLFPAGPFRLNEQSGRSLTIVPDGKGGLVAAVNRYTPGDPISTLELRALGPAGEERWSTTVWSGKIGESYYARILLRDERVPGFVVTWVDANVSPARLRAQRFDDAGVPQWGDSGVVVLDDAPVVLGHSIAPDDQGGAWFLADKHAYTGSARLCLCRVDAAGTPVTPPSGEGLWSGAVLPLDPRILRDGAGGVFVSRTYYGGYCCVDHFRRDGTQDFGPSGLPIAGDQPLQEPFLGGSGDGRAFVAWQVHPTALGWVTRVQCVDTTGAWLWPGNGVDTGSGPATFVDIPVLPDGEGGVTLCVDSWADSLGNLRAAQRFSAEGAKLWTEPPPGLIAGAPEQVLYGSSSSVTTGDGGVIYFEALSDSGDFQYPERNRLVAQRLDRYGRHGDTAPRILSLGDVPDDAGGWLDLRWAASCLEGDSAMGTARYDVQRSQPDGAGGTEWVTVAQQPATGLDEYTLAVPTLVDSIAPGAAPTSLRCRAVDAAGRTWDSPVRSASSYPNPGALGVDEDAPHRLALAPPAPSPATGSVLVRCSLPAGAAGALELFDAGGRRVRSIGLASGLPGERSLRIDLLDAGGRSLPPGLYLLRLRTPFGSRTRRLVVLGAR